MKKSGKMTREVLRHLGIKPATVLYPFVAAKMPENFRGRIVFDWSKCIGCKMCERDCPSAAIKITKVGDKQFSATFYLDKCIYCAQCVDSCPKSALSTSKKFELAQLDKKNCLEVFDVPKEKLKKEGSDKDSPSSPEKDK